MFHSRFRLWVLRFGFCLWSFFRVEFGGSATENTERERLRLREKDDRIGRGKVVAKTREEGKQRLVNMKQRMLQRILPFIHSTLPRQKNESAFSFSLFFGQNKISYFTLSFTTHCVVKN